MHRISANVYLSGSEVRVLEVLCDAALHLVLGPRVQVLVSKPHPTQQQEAWLPWSNHSSFLMPYWHWDMCQQLELPVWSTSWETEKSNRYCLVAQTPSQKLRRNYSV